MRQMVFVLRDTQESCDRLAEEMTRGWVVKQMCPMPSSIALGSGAAPIGERFRPTCAVLLEKKGK